MFSRRTNWEFSENAYTRALHRVRESGRPFFDLTASNPTTCGLLYDQAAITAALAASAGHAYDPNPKGCMDARAAIARYYREKESGVSLDPEHVFVTTGTSEAYSFLFRLLCEPGDEVLIAHPSYPLFEFLSAIQDVNLRPFRLVYDHGWQIDFHALEAAIGPRTRAILLVHPNNPTGNFICTSEAEKLNHLCAARNLALVVDEVFLDYGTPAPTPSSKGDSKGGSYGSFAGNGGALTFVLSGLSKIAALPQMKLAWIAASGPAAIVDDALARLEVIADTYLSVSGPLQFALPALLDQRARMQPQITERTRENLNQLDRLLAGQKSVSRLEMEGGWYAVLRVPAVASDEALAVRLLEEESVAVHPGHFYDFPGDGYLVLSLLPRADSFREGIERLLHLLAGI
jgi:alanine-synthesizing transaminase